MHTRIVADFLVGLVEDHVLVIDGLNGSQPGEDHEYHIDCKGREFADIARVSSDGVGNINLTLDNGAEYLVSVVRKG